jgi:hypothetical protein
MPPIPHVVKGKYALYELKLEVMETITNVFEAIVLLD